MITVSVSLLAGSPADGLAVVYVDTAANQKFTFKDIQSTAKQFGNGLLSNWAWRKGDIVALLTSNSLHVAAVSFGVLYAGGVVCPINNLSTVGELAQSLKTSGAKALVTNIDSLRVACEAANLVGLPQDRILLIDEVDTNHDVKHFASVRSSSQNLRRPNINPAEDLAFLVYSSGTTGLPKGVMLTHQNMTANLEQIEAPEASFSNWRRDRCLGFLPMYHIYGMLIHCVNDCH